MGQAKIIDIHAHIFPDKIAGKATMGTGSFYGVTMRHGGTLGGLLEMNGRCGIGRSVVCSVATAPAQVKGINDYIAEMAAAHPGLIGFATLHPAMGGNGGGADPSLPLRMTGEGLRITGGDGMALIPSLRGVQRRGNLAPRDDGGTEAPAHGAAIRAEVDRVIAMGLKGVKIHPDFQGYPIDGSALAPILSAIAGRLPLLVHAGDPRYDLSGPMRIARVMDRLPDLEIIAAHYGGYGQWDDAARHLAGRRGVWVDTSSSMQALGPERSLGLIRAFGADRVLFGTDYPMWDAADELAMLRVLNLSQRELDMILHGNAERLLGI
ncbi:MAG: amidohydrolase [Oscillospiraceae bacterium]|nr:amidohydrolase [Oscillospiraceae bacterium]